MQATGSAQGGWSKRCPIALGATRRHCCLELVLQEVLDVAVVGAGPAGLRLAYSLAKEGLKVAVVGRDAPFTNNYGVWIEELKGLGLQGTVDMEWDSCDW